MAGRLSAFQTVGFQSWKGLTSDNHIGAIYKSAPQKASNFMTQLLAFNRGKSFETLLSRFPVKTFESNDIYYWDVVGSASRNIALVEARDENGNIITDKSGTVGANGALVYLVFSEDWFAITN